MKQTLIILNRVDERVYIHDVEQKILVDDIEQAIEDLGYDFTNVSYMVVDKFDLVYDMSLERQKDIAGRFCDAMDEIGLTPKDKEYRYREAVYWCGAIAALEEMGFTVPQVWKHLLSAGRRVSEFLAKQSMIVEDTNGLAEKYVVELENKLGRIIYLFENTYAIKGSKMIHNVEINLAVMFKAGISEIEDIDNKSSYPWDKPIDSKLEFWKAIH